MKTKLLYKNRLWEAIAAHPQYDLGRREFAALVRFLPTVNTHTPPAFDVLHLASSTGREAPTIATLPGTRSYLLNDIVPEVVKQSHYELQAQFWQGLLGINFLSAVADIELPGSIAKLRDQLFRPALIVLSGNGVIFSNRQMDANIREAMRKDDLFLLAVEESHDQMFDSYLISPVFELLSKSGKEVNSNNIQARYDSRTATMHMACEGEDLLVSYKPTAKQLHERMASAGFVEVAAERYADIHMLAGLYQKG